MATPLAQLRYSRICDPADFDEPRFRNRLDELFREPDEGRTEWEAAAAAEAIDALGAAGGDDDALVLGPGTEELAAWLSARARSVRRSEHAPRRIRRRSADLVCCAGLLERAVDLPGAARTARRLFDALRPGGAASVATTVRLGGSSGRPVQGPPFSPRELRGILLADGLTWALSAPLDEALRGDPVPDGALVLEDSGARWTSAHLLLIKPLFH